MLQVVFLFKSTIHLLCHKMTVWIYIGCLITVIHFNYHVYKYCEKLGGKDYVATWLPGLLLLSHPDISNKQSEYVNLVCV